MTKATCFKYCAQMIFRLRFNTGLSILKIAILNKQSLAFNNLLCIQHFNVSQSCRLQLQGRLTQAVLIKSMSKHSEDLARSSCSQNFWLLAGQVEVFSQICPVGSLSACGWRVQRLRKTNSSHSLCQGEPGLPSNNRQRKRRKDAGRKK